MKKAIMVSLLTAFLAVQVPVYAEGIGIYIDDEQLVCETECVNINGRVLVPMRAVFEAFGSEVTWNGEDRSVTAVRENTVINLRIDSDILETGIINSDGVFVKSDSISLDVPAQIINDYTYIPVRAVSESLGAFVQWDGANNSVMIDTRSDMSGNVYYTSDSDYQKLYTVWQNGSDREKLSDQSVYGLETDSGYVYYLSKDNKNLFRANIYTGEERLTQVGVNKIGISGGYVYYQDLDGEGDESGIVYRLNTDTLDVQQITGSHVKYPRIYKNYLYYNITGDNKMYYINTDNTSISGSIGFGDEKFAGLYTFNCKFIDDYIVAEDGVWYGGIIRANLDGSDMKKLTNYNSIIFDFQLNNGKILYKKPDSGHDIYCINIDGTDEHIIAESDGTWLDATILTGIGSTVYYKNPMRKEIYKVNVDGSGMGYFGYGDDAKVFGEKMLLSYEGLYILNQDGSGMEKIYGRSSNDITVVGDAAYFKDSMSSRLYVSDTTGRTGMVTVDAVNEWAAQ